MEACRIALTYRTPVYLLSDESRHVTGRTLAMIAHVPGNILQGNWTVAVYLDDKTSPQQEQALL